MVFADVRRIFRMLTAAAAINFPAAVFGGVCVPPQAVVGVEDGATRVEADAIDYAQDGRLRADGDVSLYTVYSVHSAAVGTAIHSDNLHLNATTNTGSANNIRLRTAVPGNPPIRAAADVIQFTDTTQHFTNVAMTTCPHSGAVAEQDVVLYAEQMQLDYASGIGSAKSMRVRFKGVPIFYFPATTFPLNDDRKTGFLIPDAEYDNDSGLMVEAPYYFNIAPQYDATLTPRVFSKRGAQVHGEFRYLNSRGSGEVGGDFLPTDNAVVEKRDRYTWHYRARQDWGDNWHAHLNWQRWSDDNYLRDFGEAKEIAARYTPQDAGLNYYGAKLKLGARVRGYEKTNDPEPKPNERPYQMLPQLRFSFQPTHLGMFRADLDGEYVYFQNEVSEVEGSRLTLKPAITLPLANSFSSLELRAGWQSINYELNNNQSHSADIPIYSLDAKLFLEREVSRIGNNHFQTLEPRLFYLNIPQGWGNENASLNFDTAANDENTFANFFRKNRFTGGDRIDDTEQIAIGITSRILDDVGRQQIEFNLGQVFSLDAEDADVKTSGLFGEATATSNHWSLTAFAKLNPRQTRIETSRLATTYHFGDTTADFAYLYRESEEDENNLNLNFQAPLNSRWKIQAGGAYSLTEKVTRAAKFSMKYHNCCWSVQLKAQRYLDGQGEDKSRLSFTFALDNFGALPKTFSALTDDSQ